MRRRDFLRGLIGLGAVAASPALVRALQPEPAPELEPQAEPEPVPDGYIDLRGRPLTPEAITEAISALSAPMGPTVLFMHPAVHADLVASLVAEFEVLDPCEQDAWLDEELAA